VRKDREAVRGSERLALKFADIYVKKHGRKISAAVAEGRSRGAQLKLVSG